MDIYKTLSIPYEFSDNLLTVHLGTFSEDSSTTQYELEPNSILCVHLLIENKSSLKRTNLSLQLLEEEPLQFVAGSLKNELTKEYYPIQSYSKSKQFSLPDMDMTSKLHLKFHVKLLENCRKSSCYLQPIELITGTNITPSSCNAMIKRPLLAIEEHHQDGLIKFENRSLANTEELLYKYYIPKDINPDLTHLTAYLNDHQVSVSYLHKKNYILFQLPNIPGCKDGQPSHLNIKFYNDFKYGIKKANSSLS